LPIRVNGEGKVKLVDLRQTSETTLRNEWQQTQRLPVPSTKTRIVGVCPYHLVCPTASRIWQLRINLHFHAHACNQFVFNKKKKNRINSTKTTKMNDK